MPHNLKSGVIALAVMCFFMNPFCYADSPALFDWGKAMRSIDDNAVIGVLKAESPLGDTGAGKKCADSPSERSSLNYRKLHKYLGYSAVILAGLAAVSSSSKGVHYGAAYGSALAAAGAMTTGYIEYQDRFNPEDGLLSQDNTHILLGTIGAVACIAAVAMADSDGGGGHAGAGIIGGGAMALSIVTIKW